MDNNSLLAKYYDPDRKQLLGIDGKFWKHEKGKENNWKFVIDFEEYVVLKNHA